MEYEEMIKSAIDKKEVPKLLRGEKEYEIIVSEFSPDIFPTEINSVLVNCFYNQVDRIKEIPSVFEKAMEDLIQSGNASDVYIAVLYFDFCIFHEERGKAGFNIDKEKLASKLKQQVLQNRGKLQESITFCNGMKK